MSPDSAPAVSAPDASTSVITRIDGPLGRITLNRPSKLNALTLEMVERMSRALLDWRGDDAIAAVLIDGAGDRGLCAGGDLRANSGAAPLDTGFLRAEYRLNELIASYTKPYVALMDGVVMGGGLGISAHGSHRIVTERSRVAMPEVRIGLVPDVGVSALLARAPGAAGQLMALTARTVTGADAIAVGLADVFVPSVQLADMIEAVREACSATAGDDEVGPAVSSAIAPFTTAPPPAELVAISAALSDCFAAESVDGVLAALDRIAASEADGQAPTYAREVADQLRRMSPTAVVATYELLRRAPALQRMRAVLEAEYRAITALLRRPDAAEGVRALLIDRDEPRWNPATLDDVDRDEVLRALDEPADPPVFD